MGMTCFPCRVCGGAEKDPQCPPEQGEGEGTLTFGGELRWSVVTE